MPSEEARTTATMVAIRPSDMRKQTPILVFSVILTFQRTAMGRRAQMKSVTTE